ncbi:MAG: cobalt transporter [Rhizobiales bacterium]|nr:cobalt transporter [Hyphomicrobiales bacterium]MBA67777.1 cobalt transporter [Hyphomicrobiales bacterium]|tara:strand:+ start:1440 stop:1616 length:177 start_codon:yes stop_codon:yes gene_type:complete
MADKSISSVVPQTDARRIAGMMALLLGGLMIFGVGLAHSSALHDAAHDTRHSYGFPCH